MLCQALLPSIDGKRYYLASECLTSNPVVEKLVETANLSGIRDHLNHNADGSSHPMNHCLEQLLAAHQVSVDDARNATTDRIGFADMV